MGITALGSASGLDLESIVNALVQVERDPKLEQYAIRQEEYQVTLSAYGALKGSMSAFQDIVELLKDPDNFNQRSTSIRQPEGKEAISVEASGSSTPGSFNIKVLALAQGSRAESTPGLFTTAQDVVSNTDGNMTFSTANGSTFDVAVGAGATLEEIREAINSADGNSFVSANIINTGTESKLVLTSSETGAGNDLVITNDNAELDSISTVATGGGTAGMTVAAADMATDAEISVDGISITNSTNKFENAIQDLTITAKEVTDTDESALLAIEHNKGAVKNNIQSFVDSYNELITIMDQMTAKEAILNGDSLTRKFEQQLVRELSTKVLGAGELETLFDAGIGMGEGGKLEIRTTGSSNLNDALDDNFDQLQNLWAGDDGVANQLFEFMETYLDRDGVVESAEESVQSQLDNLYEDRDRFLLRMTSFEDRLRKQYTSLDIIVGSLNAQGDYISGQLSALSSSNKN